MFWYGECLSHFRTLCWILHDWLIHIEAEIMLRRTRIWNTKHEMDYCVVWVSNNKKQMLAITYASWKDTPQGKIVACVLDSCVKRCFKTCTLRTKHFMLRLCFVSAQVLMSNGPCHDRLAEKSYFIQMMCACNKVSTLEVFYFTIYLLSIII